jgi:hypothetical protein
VSDTVQRLQDRVDQLLNVLGAHQSLTDRLRAVYGLDVEVAVMFGMLYRRDFVTRDGLYTVMYEDRPECDWPEEKVLDVHLFKLRKAIQGSGIEIVTKWGAGWSMPAASKALVKEKLEAQDIEASTIASANQRPHAVMDGR